MHDEIQLIYIIEIRFRKIMAQREVEVNTYTLNVQSIKMKIKFVCKMKLQYNGEMLTSEVAPNDAGKFIFNQEVTMTEDLDRKYFEIIAHLSTEKGAKYIAGIVRLESRELVNQEGEMIIVPLVKCLDPDATCELRVDQVSSEKIAARETTLNQKGHRDFSPGLLKPKPFGNNFGTKSQFQFPLNNSRPAQAWTREEGNLSNYPKTRSPHHFKKSVMAATHIQRNFQDVEFDPTSRDRLIEAEVYKQSYHKLKQKYKKEAETAKHEMNKRIALENNENNYRLEVMRLKLKNQEQEKALNEKNSRIKELQIQVGAFQKKQLDLAYFKEENDNKDYTIKMLQDTIKTLNKDNQDLKSLNRQRFQSQQQKIKQLRNELDKLKLKFQTKEIELQKQIRAKSDIILQKQSQMRMKDDRLDREQKLVDDLEKNLQMKMLQFERSLQNQRNDWKNKNEDLKLIIEKLEREKSRLEEQLKESKTETEKIKSYIIKIEYDKKILNQQSDTFKQQLTELKILKEKHQELSRQHRLLSQDKNHLQKQLEKTQNSKEQNIQELTKQYESQLDMYKKNYKDLEDKYKNYQNKNLELESQLEQRKNQIERMKRSAQSLTKELNEEKQKQKNLKKSLKTKEQELGTVSGELESFKQRFRSGDQMTKIQIENLKDEIQKAKKDYEAQYAKCIQLSDKLTKTSQELTGTKLKLQQVEDSSQKNTLLSKEKHTNLQTQVRDYQRKTDDLENTINNLRRNDKENLQKIQKMELQALKSSEKINSLEKNIKSLEDNITTLENSIKNKQKQVETLTRAKQSLNQKLAETEDKLSQTKNSFNTATGEKNKNSKIIEMLNRDITQLKTETSKLQGAIAEHEKNQEELRNNIKKLKEEGLKGEMKNNGLQKQYDRFKEQLQETITSTFSQIPMSQDLRASNVSDVLYKKDGSSSTNLNNIDIINKISTQNKDIKVAMSKLLEQNKILKNETEKLTEEIQNNNSRSQINKSELLKDIQRLEDELGRLRTEREEDSIKYNEKINELNEQIDKKEQQIEDLMAQVEQHNFTINSLRMDAQANLEHYTLKQNQFKSKISEFQQKISYLNHTIEEYQIGHQQLQAKLADKSLQFDNERDNLTKRDRSIDELNQQRKNLLIIIEQNKKQRKQLLQKISELQLKLNTEVELSQKLKQQLTDEENKNSQLKEFISNLMKQKQAAIKSDLQKSEEIIRFEMQISEANRDKEMQGEEIERIRKQLQENKEIIKKQSSQIKELQSLGSDQKGKLSKTIEKLRETERELKNSQVEYQNLEKEYEKNLVKSNKQITDLQSQLQSKTRQLFNLNSQFTLKNSEAEKTIEEHSATISKLNNEMSILQEQLFAQKNSLDEKGEHQHTLEDELADAKSRLKVLTQNINTLNEQAREKEQSMFQLSGKIYNLELKVESKQTEKNDLLEALTDEWSMKYEDMKNQYEERIKLIQKERDHLKQRIKEIEEEYRKVNAELRTLELDDTNFKKILEEKIRRLEEDRLAAITSKNNEIQRISQQAKINFDALKAKQADLRRLQHQLEVARSTISKLDLNKRETEDKIRNINKVYQGELQQLKRREAQNRTSKQTLNRIQWDIERDVKKLMQNFTRKAISGESKDSSQKMADLLKDFQQDITGLLNSKLNEVK